MFRSHFEMKGMLLLSKECTVQCRQYTLVVWSQMPSVAPITLQASGCALFQKGKPLLPIVLLVRLALFLQAPASDTASESKRHDGNQLLFMTTLSQINESITQCERA